MPVLIPHSEINQLPPHGPLTHFLVLAAQPHRKGAFSEVRYPGKTPRAPNDKIPSAKREKLHLETPEMG